MASLTRSTKLPADLADAAELRSKQLGYPSWNAYIKGLIRYDLMVQGSHTVTLPVAQMRLEDQDKIDAELLARTNEGKGVRGQWLEHAIRRIAGEDKASVVKEKIGRKQEITSGR
jgi:hypothetical protein